jgi:hypothetical protein
MPQPTPWASMILPLNSLSYGIRMEPFASAGVMETAFTSIPTFAVLEDNGCSRRTVSRAVAGMPVTGCSSACGHTAVAPLAEVTWKFGPALIHQLNLSC